MDPSPTTITETLLGQTLLVTLIDFPSSILGPEVYYGPSTSIQERWSYSSNVASVTSTPTLVAFTPIGSTYGTGYSDGNDLEDPSQWYNQSFFVLVAWCLIIYSILSFSAMVILFSKGYLDWKLNVSLQNQGERCSTDTYSYIRKPSDWELYSIGTHRPLIKAADTLPPANTNQEAAIQMTIDTRRCRGGR